MEGAAGESRKEIKEMLLEAGREGILVMQSWKVCSIVA